MSSALQSALEALRSDRSLQLADVRPCSDLDAAGISAFEETWARLPTERRRQTLALFGDLAREHIELNFDRIALLAVRDPDPGVRRLAIANLWENDEAGLIAVLLEILRHDPDHRVRAESARALGKFVYQVEVDGKHADLRASLEALLLDSARAGEIEVRVTSLESLGHSSRAEVAPLIEEAYRSDSDRFREAAVLAMGRSGDARWETYVMAEMRSPSPSLRREAARAAGELELRKSVSELVELLQDTHTEVLHASIWALGQIGGKPSEKALRRFLRSRPEESLAAAAEESLEYLAFLEGTRDLEAGVRALDESR